MTLTKNGKHIVAGVFGKSIDVFRLDGLRAEWTSGVDDLCRWGELLSGQTVHEGGTTTQLTAEEWYTASMAKVLTNHTDLLTAAAAIEKARYNVRLAEVIPYPDVNVQISVVDDVTPPGPSRMVASLQVGGPIPIFDRNQGAKQQTQAALVRANEEPHRVKSDLSSRFADAFRRYEENRVLLEMYQNVLMPKQVQAFRAAVHRHYGAEPDKVAYNDLVTSEQNLVSLVANYYTVLAAQWQAVADVSALLQTDEVFRMAEEVESAPTIDLQELLRSPCQHSCPPIVAAPCRATTVSRPQ